MYKTEKLYSKDINKNIREWYAIVINHEVFAATEINTGIINNIRAIINITKYGKNIGKSNETTPYQQAVKEIKAKFKTKLKQGFKTDINSLTVNKTDELNHRKPMKAVQFRKGLMHYPAILQPKINGVRCSTSSIYNNTEDMFSKSEFGLLSKEGLEYIIPNMLNELKSKLVGYTTDSFDGELYVHNETLSIIRKRIPYKKSNGTITKHSLSNEPVRFMIFDMNIPDMNQLDRIKLKDKYLKGNELIYSSTLNKWIINEFPEYNSKVINVKHVIVHSDTEVYNHLELCISAGFEGVIVRDIDAEYMFGGRRTNMSKLKKSKSSEFELLDIIKKNEDNIRTYISFVLKNNINDLTFECTPDGSETDRQELLNNVEQYIGKLVTVTYYERTVNGLPFHAVGRIRESFDLDINDLIIE